ncbi:unnamed protein product [Cochlearia groenlandica]
MKAYMIITFLVICSILIANRVDARKIRNLGVATPCLSPNNPVGCTPPKKTPEPANGYSRGCSKITRCQRD